MKQTLFHMPKKAQAVIGSKARYKVLYGGRGSGKSYSFADAIIAKASLEKLRILCTREMQNSIKDSVHKLLSDRISELGFSDDFEIHRENITSQIGSEFIFKGLRHNISEIKSTEGIDICWVEEAEKVSDDSWTILIPTIRREDSEIWISFNPEDENSATYKRFITDPPPDCKSAFMTYEDNAFFSEVLRKEMEYDKRVDFEKYQHVWLGQVKKYGKTCIFSGKIKFEDFITPEGAQLYFGCDWGFSNDPTCLVRMFIQDRKLYIDHEFYGVGVELDELEIGFDSVPGSRKWNIKADSARPETISFMNQKGFSIDGAEKGAGSVEDGLEFLRNFEEIVVHTRCPNSYRDFNNYKWKTDRITGAVLPIPMDASNHVPDACRYALVDLIKSTQPVVWSC